MRWLSLGLLLWAGPLAAQSQSPATLDSLWSINVACAEVQPLPGGDLHDVTWLVREAPVDKQTDDTTMGEFVYPDTIYISRGWEQDLWVVRHELLHHLLRGPSPKVPHPFRYFIGCGLLFRPRAP
jgi:hypothetical protein